MFVDNYILSVYCLTTITSFSPNKQDQPFYNELLPSSDNFLNNLCVCDCLQKTGKTKLLPTKRYVNRKDDQEDKI